MPAKQLSLVPLNKCVTSVARRRKSWKVFEQAIFTLFHFEVKSRFCEASAFSRELCYACVLSVPGSEMDPRTPEEAQLVINT